MLEQMCVLWVEKADLRMGTQQEAPNTSSDSKEVTYLRILLFVALNILQGRTYTPSGVFPFTHILQQGLKRRGLIPYLSKTFMLQEMSMGK